MPGEYFNAYIPVPSGNQIYLERLRINRLLEKAVQKQVVSVVAGAGYGKTRAVCDFSKTAKNKTAWIQLTEKDNRCGRFWEHFISAISTVSMDSAEQLRKIDFPAAEEQFEKYFTLLKQKAIPGEKYLFVYDDFHLVTDRTVRGFIERCIARPFFNITSIIISREQPDFRIKKLTSKKILAEITGNELRFSRDEMAAYFRLKHIAPAPQTTSAIYRDTEGWAFAIQLAVLSLRNDFSDAAYTQNALRRNIFKFIESEVMPPLTQELRRLLIKLSFIEEIGENLNSGLLREIASGDSGLIKEMEKISSFIYLDKYLDSYHVHNLFLNYLRERQNELSLDEKKEVWTKTALWYAANNRKMDALIYYGKSGDYNAIVEVLFTLPLVLTTGMAAFVLELLDRAPGTVFRDYPRIIPIRTRALISLGRYEEGWTKLCDILPRVESLPESREKHNTLRACNLLLGFIGFIRSTHTRRYDFVRFFKAAAIESRKSESVVKAPLNGINIGFHVCRVIDPSPKEIEKFIAMLGEMIPYSVEAMGGCQYGMYELAKGEYAFYSGRFAEAEKLFVKAIKMGAEKEQYEIENRALFYLLRIHLAMGSARESAYKIESILKRMETQLEKPFYMNRNFHYDIVTGWYYIQTGRNNLVAPWLKSDYTESDLNSRGRGLEKLVKAKYCFCEKSYPAALAFLESRENTDTFLMGEIEIKALEAVSRYRLQDRAGAYKALEDAYRLASPAGLFLPFTELGKDMRALAETMLNDAAEGGGASRIPPEWLTNIRRASSLYAKRLYRLCGTARPAAEAGEGPALSPREIDVLTGLAQGLTREEIAGASSISPNTVKSAVRNVYTKLGALNRADAVRIAAAKGILP